MRKRRWVIFVALLIAGATLGSIGKPDPRVGLSSVIDLWTDALRDADQAGMRVTRLSDEEEMRIGAGIAAYYPGSTPDDGYLKAVAAKLIGHVQRPGIRYEFHIIEDPSINAFAVPGGRIFVTRGMMGFVRSEAEVAAVMGHEIAHVDLRHCIERYQYEEQLKKAGLPLAGFLAGFAHRLATWSFSPSQELEADAAGERLTIEAGYDPDAAARLFNRMQQALGEPAPGRAATPAGEVLNSVGGTLENYFRSHPPSAERSAALSEMVRQNQSRLNGSSFYIGARNLSERIAWTQREYPEEFTTLAAARSTAR